MSTPIPSVKVMQKETSHPCSHNHMRLVGRARPGKDSKKANTIKTPSTNAAVFGSEKAVWNMPPRPADWGKGVQNQGSSPFNGHKLSSIFLATFVLVGGFLLSFCVRVAESSMTPVAKKRRSKMI